MLKNSLIVGLTGGLACGKSTVAQRFSELGAWTIDADEVARTLLQQDAGLLRRIADHFGHEYLDAHRQIDRVRLKQRIFQQAADRIWLEDVVHPLVYIEIQRQLVQVWPNQYAIVVLPVLFERPPTLPINRILVVNAPETSQIQRALSRSEKMGEPADEAQVRRVLAAQLPLHEKVAKANDVIVNDQSLSYLYQQVQYYHQFYQNLLP